MQKSCSLLFVSSFIIFPLSALAIIFLIQDFSVFVYANIPIMPKLYSFSNSEASDISMANAQLWGVLLIPYLQLLTWLCLYIILIYINGYRVYLGKNIFINFCLYSCFFAFLIFISMAFVFNDLELTRFGRKSPDFSIIMSVNDYAEWQSKIYVSAMGIFTAINFLLLSRVIMYKKVQ